MSDKENMFIKNQAGVSVGQTFHTGIYENAGFVVSAILDSVYCAEINSLANPEKFYNNVAVGSVFYIPKLLEVHHKDNIVSKLLLLNHRKRNKTP